MTDVPHPPDSLPPTSAPCSSGLLFLSQALELCKSYDATKHSVGGLKAFNQRCRMLLEPPSGPPPSSPQSAAADVRSRSEDDDQRGEAAAVGGFGLGARDDDGGGNGDDDGAREVAEGLESATFAFEDEAASEVRAEPEPEPEPTVDVLCVELGSFALGTEADVCNFARTVADLFAERSDEQMAGAFVREVQAQLAARRAEQVRPRRLIVQHRRLSITTLAALPGMRAAAARAATTDVHASEVAALTELLVAARAELAEAKAGLAQAEERRRQFERKPERKRVLAEVTDGGNAPR